MANDKVIDVLEKSTSPVALMRRSGSFDKDGETVKYSKLFLLINGAEVDLDLDKSSKNLINAFVQFVKA